MSISEGALANRFQRVKPRLDDRVGEMLTRLRSSRLICSDETGARIHGRTQGEWVFQHAEVWVHVIRPSRGHGVIQAILGAHRPPMWVSDRSSAQMHHPAEDWQVCLAQQVRECPLALEAGDTMFAPRMQAVLLRALALHTRRDTRAASTRYQDRCALQRRVDRCFASQPTNTHGKRLRSSSRPHASSFASSETPTRLPA